MMKASDLQNILRKLSDPEKAQTLQRFFKTKPGQYAEGDLFLGIQVPQTRISQIIKGNRSISADTALRLSKYFGNSAKFWLGLQNDFDLEEEYKLLKKELELISQNDWA